MLLYERKIEIEKNGKKKKKENYFCVNFNQAGDELKLPKNTLGILNSDDTDAEDDV